MRRARDIILAADDRVTESIKWNTPTCAFRGNIASFNPSKSSVRIMLHRGAEIPGRHPRLEGDGKLVRTMRFVDLDDVESRRADLERVIRAWCQGKAEADRPPQLLVPRRGCGDDRIRTGDLLVANQALFRLSYIPALTLEVLMEPIETRIPGGGVGGGADPLVAAAPPDVEQAAVVSSQG